MTSTCIRRICSRWALNIIRYGDHVNDKHFSLNNDNKTKPFCRFNENNCAIFGIAFERMSRLHIAVNGHRIKRGNDDFDPSARQRTMTTLCTVHLGGFGRTCLAISNMISCLSFLLRPHTEKYKTNVLTT